MTIFNQESTVGTTVEIVHFGFPDNVRLLSPPYVSISFIRGEQWPKQTKLEEGDIIMLPLQWV